MSDLQISITSFKKIQFHVPLEREKYADLHTQLLNLENIYFKIQILPLDKHISPSQFKKICS